MCPAMQQAPGTRGLFRNSVGGQAASLRQGHPVKRNKRILEMGISPVQLPKWQEKVTELQKRCVGNRLTLREERGPWE